ncbi:hypothetical protein BIW11_01502 [Tropilaelaps mercedesae]|uniref:Ig-like domain-containing protein n=1 Tax=Tropilaelaps mercedesae TaxID=418985 RepID=A0A1V9XDK1_9ACAR|nr:hypothetical protein BIW11_01502 [Tropilaelaps mercedesae]
MFRGVRREGKRQPNSRTAPSGPFDARSDDESRFSLSNNIEYFMFQLPLFFREEPPSAVVFLNSTGAVIPCDGGGISKPRAVWTRPDGTPLSPIAGLRQFRNDGSMVLQPFAGDQFRTEVHSGLFRCQLTSDAGSIGSRDVRISAGRADDGSDGGLLSPLPLNGEGADADALRFGCLPACPAAPIDAAG